MSPHRHKPGYCAFSYPFSYCTPSPDYLFSMLVKAHRSLEIINLFLRMEQIIYLAVNHKVSPGFVQQAPDM